MAAPRRRARVPRVRRRRGGGARPRPRARRADRAAPRADARLALEAPPPRRGAARGGGGAGAGGGGGGERAAEPAAPLLHHGLRPQAARAPAPDDGQRRQHVRGRPPRRTRALHRGQQPLHGGAGARDAGPARRLQRPLRRERRLRVEGGARGPQVRHDDAAPPRDAQEAPGLRPLPLRRGRRPRRIEARARLLRRELTARGRAGRPQVRPGLAALREERHRRAPAPRHAPRRRGRPRPRASRRVARVDDANAGLGAEQVMWENGVDSYHAVEVGGRLYATMVNPHAGAWMVRAAVVFLGPGTAVAPRRRRARSSGSTTSSATSSTCPRPRGPSRASAPAAGTST